MDKETEFNREEEPQGIHVKPRDPDPTPAPEPETDEVEVDEREEWEKFTITSADFPLFPDEKTFRLALTCGPITRFEVRKAMGDLQRARSRVETARTVHTTEVEQAMGSTSMTDFVDRYVAAHEKRVPYYEARVKFLQARLNENFGGRFPHNA